VSDDVHEVHAITYARVDRRSPENFLGGDPHDVPMPLNYYVWLIVREGRTIVVDTGFDQRGAELRKREITRPVREGLTAFGVDPGGVEDVIITHLHYDHVGDFEAFPHARFHLQDREMAYATGRHMCHDRLRKPFDIEHVTGMVRQVYAGRVAFHDGAVELDRGLSLHRVGGHSDGLQIVRVHTRRGWVVVASDASHFYANLETGNPFPLVFNVGDMLEGHRTCLRLAESPAHVVPGHDPLVMRRYPAPSPELEGVAVRLDVEPRD
jgi:glyoxylase-like metal-dependent hydrolase (beta-lactamase superfamily II)